MKNLTNCDKIAEEKEVYSMIANFHTHTYRCHHAKGTEREYVLAAIAAGIQFLGIADHAPYWFPGDYYSGHRMAPSEIPEYTGELMRLREEFKDDITLYIGYETEYYPDYFANTVAMFDTAPYDYLILGQHYLYHEVGEPNNTTGTDDPARLDQYVVQVSEGLKTGRFFYLCHPDIFKFTGDTDYYRMKMEELCRTAKALDIPLEINLLGVREHRSYPCEEFWQIAGKVGNKAILGCDAHHPDQLARPNDLSIGQAWAERFGLE
ncbi:MAG: histidinol-phosphatase, partial [Ruminococcus sp.]|nr:histidinol-phosphatase [Candidatus Apopatosoma intestinale]